MIAQNLASLLRSLEDAEPSLSLEEVVQQVRQHTQPPGHVALLKQCSLVRSFDSKLFDFLCQELPDRVAFEEFIRGAGADVLSDGHGWWRVETLTREHHLKTWQTQRTGEWEAWNRKLAGYFLGQTGPSAQVHALYHLAVSDRDRALSLFRQWFAEADKAFDLAQCNALLEILKTQENWRGPSLTEAWQTHRQQYLARSLFLQDYYKTAAYLERKNPLIGFRLVLNGVKPGRWIFHIHATGGIGKTMFLRWLISRELIPNKIPCVRIDFDDFPSVSEVVNAPLRLMHRIVDQLNQQLPNASLIPLLERLRREQDSPGWNADIMAELRRHFKGARIETPVVLILDTLEEPTLSHGQWLRESISQLRTFRDSIPKLCLVLSGRYNVVQRVPGLESGEFLHFELKAFSQREAGLFLGQRGIPEGEVRNAMIRKAGGEPFTGANPFKLALLTELALNRQVVSPQDIERLPRVDFAYLIERIVLRIENQPLRWVIRYGAIPRDLTRGFIEEVLLEPLAAALRGEQRSDQPSLTVLEGMERYLDVWMPEPRALTGLDAGSLWDDLVRFSRDRGWITLVDSRAQLAHFHPEVINPTRDLLRAQPVFAELQRRAIAYFERLAKKAPDSQSWASAICEAVFHHFQLEGASAVDYWKQRVQEAQARGIDAAIRVAREVLGRDYAEGEIHPLSQGDRAEPIIAAGSLIEAHWLVAELLLERSGVSFFPETAEAGDFRRHLELARAIGGSSPGVRIPEFLEMAGAAFAERAPGGALQRLEQPPRGALSKREQFLLEVQLAEHCARLGRPAAPAHYRQALKLWSSAEVTAIQPYQVLLRLADWHQSAGDYASTMEACREARQTPGISKDVLVEILHREAICALAVNDLPEAGARAETLRSKRFALQGQHARRLLLLEARIALENDDVMGVARRCEQLVPDTGGQPAETALAYELLGQAANRRLDFSEALNHFERAAKLYDAAQIPTGSARCAVLQMRTSAMLQGRLREAESILHHAFSLPGARDMEIAGEMELLRAFIISKSGRLDEATFRTADLLAGRAISWPVRSRARLMFAAFACGWSFPSPAFLDEMLRLIEWIQPISARYRVLEILDNAGNNGALKPAYQRAILRLFPEASRDSSLFFDMTLDRARLRFLFGDAAGARHEVWQALKYLPQKGPLEAQFLKLWKLNRVALKVGAPTDFTSMADSRSSGFLETSPLAAAVKIHASSEAIQAGRLPRAGLLLDWARNRLSSEAPYNVWQGRLEEASAALATAKAQTREANDHLESAVRLYDQLGNVEDAERVRRLLGAPAAAAPPVAVDLVPADGARLAPGGPELALSFDMIKSYSPQRAAEAGPVKVSLRLTESDMPDLAAAPRELILDRMLGGWAEFAGDLDRVLLEEEPAISQAHHVTLDVQPGPLAALPWEIAPSLRKCAVLHRRAPQGRSQGFFGRIPRSQPDAVRLLLPERNQDFREQISYQGTSGVDLARLYASITNTVPGVSYAPLLEELAKDLARRPCAVLHVVAAVREFSGGIYLDFRSTEARVDQVQGKSLDFSSEANAPSIRRHDYSYLTPTFLDRLITSLPQPPFIILDIARSDNNAETLRRLLLRNSYADQLLQLGHTCGILAAGLADRFAQELAIGPLLRELMGGAPLSAVARTVRGTQHPTSPYDPLVSELPWFGAALFADDPHISPFAPIPSA